LGKVSAEFNISADLGQLEDDEEETPQRLSDVLDFAAHQFDDLPACA